MSAVLSEQTVTVRDMRPADVADVVAIERVSYDFPWTEGIFFDCLRASYRCRVADLASGLAGYVITTAADREAHILNLCVAPDCRSTGLGRRLLQDALRSAVNEGASQMFLEVRPSNKEACRLYESVGFDRIAVRRDYYRALDGRQDALVLRLYLDGRVLTGDYPGPCDPLPQA